MIADMRSKTDVLRSEAKQKIFFIKSQNRQKLSKNDKKTFQDVSNVNFSETDRIMLIRQIFFEKNEKM